MTAPTTATAPPTQPVDRATAYLRGTYGENYREVLGLGAPGEHPHADHYEPGEVTPLGALLAGLTADELRAVRS